MVLLIDIGNTTVGIRVMSDDGGDWIGSYRFPTGESEDYVSLFSGLALSDVIGGSASAHGCAHDCDCDGASSHACDCANARICDCSCVISSVVPSVSVLVSAAVSSVFGIEPRLLKKSDISMPVVVDEPEKVGMDRLVEAYYIYKNCPLPAVTVDMGTATTIGVVTEEGFIGGSISAGVMTSLDAIGGKGAQLFKVEPYAPSSVIGKNTTECLNIGAVYGAAAMVDGLIKQISYELGADVTSVITGGNSGLIRNLLSREIVFDEDLIFNGLREIYFDLRR